MTFQEALKKLNIEDYADRIWNSNSHGELFFIQDYINMATSFKGDMAWFRPLFRICVYFAEQSWKRPESCFQHMPRLMANVASTLKTESETTKP
jgi:hypothetical protein